MHRNNNNNIYSVNYFFSHISFTVRPGQANYARSSMKNESVTVIKTIPYKLQNRTLKTKLFSGDVLYAHGTYGNLMYNLIYISSF